MSQSFIYALYVIGALVGTSIDVRKQLLRWQQQYNSSPRWSYVILTGVAIGGGPGLAVAALAVEVLKRFV